MLVLKIILKVVFFIIAAVMFIPAKIAYYGGADQKTWVQTQATVTKSQLGTNVNSKGTENEFKSYFWDVEYSYNFNGKEYSAEGIYVSAKTSNGKKRLHQQRADQHPVGSTLNVFVNPKSPEEAYVYRRTEGAIESWYKTTRIIFYISILLFFTPLIGMAFKAFATSNAKPATSQQAQTNAKTQPVKPTPEPTIQRKSQGSDDGFDI